MPVCFCDECVRKNPVNKYAVVSQRTWNEHYQVSLAKEAANRAAATADNVVGASMSVDNGTFG